MPIHTAISKLSIIILLGGATLFAQNQDYKSQLNQFYQYKQQQYNSFRDYKQALHKAFLDYKKSVGAYWSDPKLSTKKEWVRYSKDFKTRSLVDFQNNKITIETIAKNEKEAAKKIKKTLADVVTLDTIKAFKTDPLEQKLAKIPKPKEIIDAPIDQREILAPVVFRQKPDKFKVAQYVDTHIQPKKITKQKSQKFPGSFIYKAVVTLPKDTTYKRSKIYLSDVKSNAKKQQLPIDLIFAIIHTESSYNPKATSPVPAYGLMQIVPKTAGIDSYYYLYRVKKQPSRWYLYNAKNNIKLGSAYLHILYYRYLKDIKNPQSRLYCAIAAYNTGAGNIAWAFTRNYNVKKAAKRINQLSPDEVYVHLQKHLRYEEPKAYLRRVLKRMQIYHKLYGS